MIKEQIDPAQWKQVPVRDTERKELKIDMVCLRVYPVERRLPGKGIGSLEDYEARFWRSGTITLRCHFRLCRLSL
ncbi:Uncharacterised protein [uncultured archaeon]|nr:Uncharacterised protein [uncultured archaeon]